MLVPVQGRAPRLASEETGAEITVGGRGGGAGGDGEGGAYDTAPLSGARGVRVNPRHILIPASYTHASYSYTPSLPY